MLRPKIGKENHKTGAADDRNKITVKNTVAKKPLIIDRSKNLNDQQIKQKNEDEKIQKLTKNPIRLNVPLTRKVNEQLKAATKNNGVVPKKQDKTTISVKQEVKFERVAIVPKKEVIKREVVKCRKVAIVPKKEVFKQEEVKCEKDAFVPKIEVIKQEEVKCEKDAFVPKKEVIKQEEVKCEKDVFVPKKETVKQEQVKCEKATDALKKEVKNVVQQEEVKRASNTSKTKNVWNLNSFDIGNYFFLNHFVHNLFNF